MTAPAKVPVPTNARELEEILSDKARVDQYIIDGQFQELVQNYARAVNEKDKDISLQIAAEVERVTAEWLRENGARDKDITRPNLAAAVEAIKQAHPGDVTRYNPQALGAQLDNDFDSAWEYFATVWHPTVKSGFHPRLGDVSAKLTKVRNAFSSNVPSEGGFLIPETLRSQLLSVAMETAIMRPRAMVVPMETLRVPFPSIDATSNVSSVFGGITAFWTEEGAALTPSQASFGRVVLDAKKLTAFTDVPNELLSDSLISFQTLINMMFPKALAWFEDVAFIKGSGAGEPFGIINPANPAIIAVAKVAGQSAASNNQIIWDNIVAMYSRMLPSSLNNAIWLVTPDAFPQLATMALNVGTGGAPVWLVNGQGDAPVTLLSRPVVITEKAPGVLGAQGDISFVDPSFYLIGDRQVMAASSSEHYRFGNDMTSFRIIERADGRPWLQSAITPQNAGPALSPFVQLAARP